jgi:transcription antitermination factor NusG
LSDQEREESRIMAEGIIEAVKEGDVDTYLSGIISAAYDRKKAVAREVDFEYGRMVRVVRVNPKYLIGMEAKIHKVNKESVRVMVPDEARYRKYRGRDIGFPKTSLELI